MNEKPQKSPLGQYVLSYRMDDYIYRILKFEHLISIFQEGVLKFPRICAWDDTYENYIYKSRFKIGEHDFGVLFKNFNYQERFWGLCWSYWEESDALWKIYSPDNKGVKIKSKVGKLYNAVNEAIGNIKIPLFQGFGRIVYVKKENLNILFSHEMLLNNGNDMFLTHDGLFVKRMEFEYENEFRTILISSHPLSDIHLFPITVNPFDVIEEVVFHPKMEDNLVSKYSQMLDSIGFHNYRKSSLYAPLEFTLLHNHELLNQPYLTRF